MFAAPAKLILLGEHTLLHGSAAYAVPFRRYEATLRRSDIAGSSPLLDFAAWQAFAKTQPDLAALDHGRWAKEAGYLNVTSDIPMGYGLGSSGALCALVMKRYLPPTVSFNATQMRACLAALEGYFHGSSSGIDPFVSYHNAGVRFSAASEIEILADQPLFPRFTAAGRWGLIDSHQPRAGKKLIARFGESCTNRAWRDTALKPMCVAVNALTSAIGDMTFSGIIADSLSAKLETLSSLQLRYLDYLIPENMQLLWRKLADQGAYMKLCGAGGGGYFLVYASNPAAIQISNLEWLH